MDTRALAIQLIRAVRGRLSQERLSQRLGYKSNVLYLWERGRRMPTLGAFLQLALVRRKPVRDGLAAFIGDSPLRDRVVPSTESATVNVTQLVRWLAGERSTLEMARLTGFDRTTIGRWRSGSTEPRLSEFLTLVLKTTQRLLEFVAVFCDPAELVITKDAYAQLGRQQRVAYELPWSHAVLHALDLGEYLQLPRHRSSWLASRLGLTRAEVQALLTALAESGVIERHQGRWRKRQVLSVDTRSDFAQNRSLKQHWAATAAERIHRLEPQHRSLYSYNLFPISTADLERLRELHLDYYARVRELVADAKGADHVVLVNVQLCALDE